MIPLTMAPRGIRYVAISLTKGWRIYKMPLKEIKDLNLNKWKDTPCSGIRTHNIAQMSALPMASNLQIQHNPCQNPYSPFPRNGSQSLNPHGITRSPEKLKQCFKKNKTGGLTPPGFKTYHKAAVTNITWLWRKGRHVDHGIGSRKKYPCGRSNGFH